MPTNPENEVNQGPAKRKNQKKIQDSNSQPTNELEGNEGKQNRKKRKNRPRKRRAFPIWLRIIVVLILCAAALIIGAMIGYGVIGDGNPTDALDMDTWRHILDLMGN